VVSVASLLLGELGDGLPLLRGDFLEEDYMRYLEAQSPYTFFVSPKNCVVSFLWTSYPPPLKNPRNATV